MIRLKQLINEENDFISKIMKLTFGKKVMGNPSTWGKAREEKYSVSNKLKSFAIGLFGKKVLTKPVGIKSNLGGEGLKSELSLYFPDVNVRFENWHDKSKISIMVNTSGKQLKAYSYMIRDIDELDSAIIEWIKYNKDALLSLNSSKTNPELNVLFQRDVVKYQLANNPNDFIYAFLYNLLEQGLDATSGIKKAIGILNKFIKMKDFISPSSALIDKSSKY